MRLRSAAIGSVFVLSLFVGACNGNDGNEDTGTQEDTAVTDTGMDTTDTTDARDTTDTGPQMADCSSPEQLNGPITESRTLGPNECYVSSSLQVKKGGVLTLEEGVIIQFEKGSKLELKRDGTLKARGTEDRKVTLTGTTEESGWWRGIMAGPKGTVDLEWGVVEYAGADDGKPNRRAIRLKKETTLTMTDTTVRNNEGWGLILRTPENVDILGFENNDFSNNSEAPVLLPAVLAPSLSASTNFKDNGTDVVWLRGGLPGQIDQDTTLGDLGVPYRVSEDNSLTTKSDAEVAFEAGVTVEFEKNARFDLNGANTIVTNGTSDEKVTFTGSSDERGWWRGIHQTGANSLTLDFTHTIVENAASGDDPAGLELTATNGSVTLRMKQTTLRKHAGHGLTATKAGTTIETFKNNTITNNKDAPLDLPAALVGSIDTSSTLTGNDTAFFEVAGTVDRPTTFRKFDIPYLVDDRIQVKSNGKLTVKPGVEVVVAEDTRIQVGGTGDTEATIVADGSGGDTIVFRGKNQEAGYWEGIDVKQTESDANILSNVTIDGAGTDNSNGNVGLYSCCGNQTTVTLSSITFKRCGTGGALFVKDKPANIKPKGCANLELGTGCSTEITGHDDVPKTFQNFKMEVCQ